MGNLSLTHLILQASVLAQVVLGLLIAASIRSWAGIFCLVVSHILFKGHPQALQEAGLSRNPRSALARCLSKVPAAMKRHDAMIE